MKNFSPSPLSIVVLGMVFIPVLIIYGSYFVFFPHAFLEMVMPTKMYNTTVVMPYANIPNKKTIEIPTDRTLSVGDLQFIVPDGWFAEDNFGNINLFSPDFAIVSYKYDHGRHIGRIGQVGSSISIRYEEGPNLINKTTSPESYRDAKLNDRNHCRNTCTKAVVAGVPAVLNTDSQRDGTDYTGFYEGKEFLVLFTPQYITNRTNSGAFPALSPEEQTFFDAFVSNVKFK